MSKIQQNIRTFPFINPKNATPVINFTDICLQAILENT